MMQEVAMLRARALVMVSLADKCRCPETAKLLLHLAQQFEEEASELMRLAIDAPSIH